MARQGVFLATFFVKANPEPAVLPVDVRQVIPSAAPMRANVKTNNPISARLRRPTTVFVSMLSSSWRASVAASTGVLPTRTTYLGAAHGGSGIYGQNLADHQPVEQHAHGRQPLLDAGR
jgi:hypothetical protein